MPLRAILESLDDVDEATKAVYVEKQVKDKDGRDVTVFALDVDGIDSHPSVVNLKNAFERQKADNAKLKIDLRDAQAKTKDLPEDFDPEEWQRLKALSEQDPNKNKDQFEELKRMYEDRVRNITATKDKEIADLKADIERQKGTNHSLIIRTELDKAMDEVGIAIEHRDLVRDHLLPKAKISEDDDKLVPVVETDLNPEMPLKDYVDAWAQSDKGRRYVKPAEGGGSRGARNQKTAEPNPFEAANWSKTLQGTVLTADRAKAEALAKQAGFKSLDDAIKASLPIKQS